MFSILANPVAGLAAAYFSRREPGGGRVVASPGPPIPREIGGVYELTRVMKKPRPPVSHDLEDGLTELRAMATDVLRRRAQTGGQAAIAALRKLGLAPGA
jgi:hypothetical protein